MEPEHPERPPRTAEDFARLNEPHESATAERLEVRERLGGAAEAIKDRTREFVEERKDEGAERISRLGDAVRRVASDVGEELPEAAGFIRSAAENLEGAAKTLRNHSIGDLTERFNRFARRRPGAAFTGSVLAGLAFSRFLKSSSRH